MSLRDQRGLVLSDLTLGNRLALKGPRDLARLPDAYHRAEHDVLVALSFLGILINQLERLLNVALFLEVSLVIESQPQARLGLAEAPTRLLVTYGP